MDRDAVDAGVWGDRVCGRLHQGGARRNLGLTARAKLGLQFVVSAAVAVALLRLETRGSYSTRLMVPFVKRFRPDLVWEWMGHIPHMHWLAFLPFVVFVMLVIAGSSNAVNLTDGLDGLAIGCTIIAAGALAVLTYVSGHVVFSDYLELERMPLVSEVTIFCGSMVGASIGFLWYNAHPAEVFMGDVGAWRWAARLGRSRWSSSRSCCCRLLAACLCWRRSA